MLIENTNSATKWQVGVEGGTYIGAGTFNIGIDAVGSKLAIDSSGRVGIGTTSPDTLLNIQGLNPTLLIQDSDEAGDGFIKFQTANGTQRGYIQTAMTSNVMIFGTGTSERVRIDSSGNLLVGITAGNPGYGNTDTGATVRPNGLSCFSRSGADYAMVVNSNNAAVKYLIAFRALGSEVGYITSNGTSTTYATTSDYRLKEDWVAVADASTRVNALKPVNFAWKADGSRVDGFLAHELAEVVPEAVTGTKDAMRDEEYEVTPAVLDDEGAVVTPAVMGTRSVPAYQGIDQSKLVPLLTAALQEALAKIDDLTARVSALETA
jgi:hypothetical protein